MAREAKVVVVDLAATSQMMSAVSVDPDAPGLAELMQGEVSFAQIITKDKLSRVHLVTAGRPGFDRALLQSPRLTLAIDALLGSMTMCCSTPAPPLTSRPNCSLHMPVRWWCRTPRWKRKPAPRCAKQLRAVGFADVAMLSKACQASDAVEVGPRVVAA